jgi:hypothetical protein
MKIFRTLSLLLAVLLGGRAAAQTYETNNVYVQTFAGSGFYGNYDGQGVLTMFNAPSAIVADSFGNFFVYDSNAGRIRKITPAGAVTTFVGGGNGSLPGFGTNVSLPYGYYGYGTMTIDHSNVLWLAAGGYLLRIGPDGYVAPVNPSVSSPAGLCVDSANNLYYSSGNQILRYNQATGLSEVFVGSGNPGSVDGNYVFTSFNNPSALAADAANNIYVWDSGSQLIRRIKQNRNVETIAGTNIQYCYNCDADGVGSQAQFSSVNAMSVDNYGRLLLACGTSIRRMTATTNVTTLAGSFTQIGYTNGIGSEARFINARGICMSQGLVFIADAGDHRIRKITFDSSPQLVPETNLSLRMTPSLSITGEVGRSYRIESSPNLTNWNPEATILLRSTPYLWLDESAQGQAKYYRTFLMP